MVRHFAFIAALSVAVVAPTFGDSPAYAQTNDIVEREIESHRIRLSDVWPGAPADIAQHDLGPAPPAGGSRTFTREQLEELLQAPHTQKAVAHVPATLRLTRKIVTLDAERLGALTRRALGVTGLPRGATLAVVKPPANLRIADGFDTIRAEVPRPPKRKGRHKTSATITFIESNAVVGRANVPIELDLSEEALLSDLTKGAPVQLVVRRGLVEIRASAFATVDADIGDDFPAQMKPSGRIVRATLLPDGSALVMENHPAPPVKRKIPYLNPIPLNGGYR